MSKENKIIGEDAIHDVRSLSKGKIAILSVQHVFAMFGATVLVPIMTGLSVSTTLLMAGLGTLLFHLITKRKVPAFLGSSFAFLGGYAAVAAQPDGTPIPELLPYACGGVAIAGLVYVILAAFIRFFGANKVMRYFPPVVTGPIIVSIGLSLAPTAINNCKDNWLIAFVALAVIILCNIFGKGMVKIIPIMLGIIASYIVALCLGEVNFDAVSSAKILDVPFKTSQFAKFSFSAIITIVPISLATMMEHIGDISAIGATTGKNYIKDPGLHRTLIGDGLATTLSAIFGGPANTTYGENTGVLALTKVYDPLVMEIAAGIAVVLSFFPKIEAFINSIPKATIGGVSFVLYGMISAIGIRNVVENQIDFTKSRNLIIAAVILVSAIGFNGTGISFAIGTTTINLSGIAIAALSGIFLNAILPGNDYVFDAKEKHDELTFKI